LQVAQFTAHVEHASAFKKNLEAHYVQVDASVQIVQFEEHGEQTPSLTK
jgi:hypothetical protein